MNINCSASRDVTGLDRVSNCFCGLVVYLVDTYAGLG